MSNIPDQNKGMTQRLAEDELNFCCMYSFIRETNRWSQNKVASAMGVSPQTIRYWRDRKRTGKIRMCPKCKAPQPILEIKRRAKGKFYFVRIA